jgi:hypothetical protein
LHETAVARSAATASDAPSSSTYRTSQSPKTIPPLVHARKRGMNDARPFNAFMRRRHAARLAVAHAVRARADGRSE